jgi:tRNA(His) 5'-end guanylyltransferase
MGNKKDSLGDRMKENYENRSKTFLTRRMPCIIRLDGKAFHSFTRNFKKPYDEVFHEAMNSTLQYLCKNIQGCKFGYTQSDEISLLLTDYDTLTTDAWFGYNVQKMASIAASMATLHFNQAFRTAVNEYTSGKTLDKYDIELLKAKDKGAMFDARCFSIPAAEVVNCFIWRQQDATRNAVQMLGQTYFSSSQLHKKSTSVIQEMLWQEHKINFNDMPIEFKRGICCFKTLVTTNGVARSEWFIDKFCPIFTQDRGYIERFLPKEG